MAFKVPNQFRLRTGRVGSEDRIGCNGVFLLPPGGAKGLFIGIDTIASSGDGWEHVSAKPRDQKRCLTWDEMCVVKSIFWDEEDCVMQLHPSKEDYVNNHPFVLHLWRPIFQDIPKPPKYMV